MRARTLHTRCDPLIPRRPIYERPELGRVHRDRPDASTYSHRNHPLSTSGADLRLKEAIWRLRLMRQVHEDTDDDLVRGGAERRERIPLSLEGDEFDLLRRRAICSRVLQLRDTSIESCDRHESKRMCSERTTNVALIIMRTFNYGAPCLLFHVYGVISTACRIQQCSNA
jgi:hypothetical protein